MFLIMKKDVLLNSVDVRFLRADGVMLFVNLQADVIKQFHREIYFLIFIFQYEIGFEKIVFVWGLFDLFAIA